MGHLAALSNAARTFYNDYVVTGPKPFFQPIFRAAPDDTIRRMADLHSSGVADLGLFGSAQDVSALRSAMDAACQGSHPDTSATFSETSNYHVIANPLALHASALQLATHPLVCALVERYFRNRVCLADVDARVIPPTKLTDIEKVLVAQGLKANYSSSHWHRDARGRQVKVMMYLSDVGEEDSRFVYLPGTQRGASLHPSYEETRFSDENVGAMPVQPVEWLGVAGSAKLFDTNIIHRLQRRATGSVRYSITFYYTPGQQLKPITAKRAHLDALSSAARKVVLCDREERVTIID
jgi:hypothetical protein